MSYNWRYKKSNFFQQSIQDNHSFGQNDRSNQRQKTKAYLNPDLVDCEYIKRSISKNCLKAGNKIHVNPNFGGNLLSKVNNKVHFQSNNLGKTITLNKMPSEAGPSNTSNVSELNNRLFSLENHKLNNATVITHQSRFKKVNVNGNLRRKNPPLYSCKETNFTNPNSRFSINRKILTADKLGEKKYQQTFNGDAEKCWGNSVSPKNKFSFKDKKIYSPVKRNLGSTRFVCNKICSITKVAKAVRSKYKYLNNVEQNRKSKYKIDKRNNLQDTVKSKLTVIQDIRKLFPNNSYHKVKLSSYKIYNVNSCHILSKKESLWRKNQVPDKSNHKVQNQFSNKKVVKIGGILYKSTTNKLTLANKAVASDSSKSVISKTKAKKNHIVHVRGETFILENNGKALRRLNQNKKSKKAVPYTLKRIDIGGVTYIQSSQNVLIRTNVHRARHLVNKAKNKSIAMLANLRKKSLMPCMIYHKFGKCNRNTKGLCIYKHDSKNIALCKNFLKGNCVNKNCLLSHEVIQEKMATCHFFLNGLCVRENCPFLHVKLNKKVAICKNFLQGFCSLGMNCPKRHFHQCPEFDKFGTCSLGSKCHYPHIKQVESISNNLPKSSENLKNQDGVIHYHTCSDIQKKQKRCKKSLLKKKEINSKKVYQKAEKRKPMCLSPQESDDIISCFPKRIRLDKLPCYIPLKSDS